MHCISQTHPRRSRVSIVGVGLVALGAVAVVGAFQTSEAQAPKDAQARLAKADTIAAKVAEIRGLKQKRPIQRGVMQKDQIRQRLLKRIDEEYSPAELAAEALALKRIGLLPEDIDFKQVLIELLTDQIAGFYDPAERRLYIAGWQQGSFGAAGDDMVMAHEIGHALQDQHFDLRKFLKDVKKNGDASLARQALVEGDGMALMLEYMMAGMGMQAPWGNPALINSLGPQMSASMATGKLGQAPRVLRESLVFPYLRGVQFVAHFRKHHPWSRIDAIFRKPPLSTEQIIHPEKYERYERPDEIKIGPIKALKGYKRIFENVTGEAGLGIFLREHLEAPAQGDDKAARALADKTDRAAAGWGGDRIAIYTPPGHSGALAGTIGIAYTVWDRAADAVEFFEALADAMPALANGKAVWTEADHVAYKDSAGAMFLAQRKGDAVVLVAGANADKASLILAQVWQHWRVRRR